MNSRIQQILAMNKAGILTDEQSAQLIEELLKTEPAASGAASPGSRASAAREPIGAVWQKAVSRSVEAVADRVQAKYGGGRTDSQSNSIQLSHFEFPEGPGVIFSGNQVRMSKAREFDLERSEMTDNRFDACRLQEIRLRDAQLRQCHFTSSSVEELVLDHGEIQALELFSSKWSEVKIKEDSRIEGVQMRSSVVKEVGIAGRTHWRDSSFNSSVLSEARLQGARFAQCRMDETKFSEIGWESCEWQSVVTRAIGFEKINFTGCRFNDVVFAADGNCFGKRWSWAKTNFENCQLERVLFADCQTRHTVIRGVTLQDTEIRGADLSGLTLEGNEAFLRAVAAHRS